MSNAIRVELAGIERLGRRIARLADLDRKELASQLASLGESQTRRRIQSEQETPDGTPWAPWSDDYAETRHGGQGLLQGEGDLMDSLTSEADAGSASWGSNLVYAAIHQHGGTEDMAPGPAGIPAREYLGLSAANQDELEAVVDDWLDQQLEQL